MQLFIKDYIVLGVLYYSKLAAHSSKWKSKVILHGGIMAKWKWKEFKLYQCPNPNTGSVILE